MGVLHNETRCIVHHHLNWHAGIARIQRWGHCTEDQPASEWFIPNIGFRAENIPYRYLHLADSRRHVAQ